MNSRSDKASSFFTSLKGLVETLLQLAQKRLQLIAVEFHEERLRWFEALLCLAGVVAFGVLALTMLSFALVLVFWEMGRLYALFGLMALYVVAAFLCYRALINRIKHAVPFAATIEEFKKDQAWLSNRN